MNLSLLMYSFSGDIKGVVSISERNVAQLSLPTEMKQTKKDTKTL